MSKQKVLDKAGMDFELDNDVNGKKGWLTTQSPTMIIGEGHQPDQGTAALNKIAKHC